MSQRRRLLALALLLVVLLTSACATSVAKKAPTATPMSTPPPLTIKPARPLVWTTHNLPPGLIYAVYNRDGPALAQSDSDTAYLCALANGQAQVWATHDRAEHWAVSGSVPVASDVAECYIVVDAMLPRQALLRTYAPDGQCCGQYTGEIRTYLTTDGGATWTPREAPTVATPIFTNLATANGVSYALASTRPHSHCVACYYALFTSKDGMRTWTRIDDSLFLRQGFRTARDIVRFWLGPSGELLVEGSSNTAGATLEFWRSNDQGAHWNPIGFGKTGVVENLIVAASQGPRFWRLCAVYGTFNGYAPASTQEISCTLDGGKTWLDTGGANSYGIGVFAQAADGAILAVKRDGSLVRVAPGQSAWESLGTGGGVYVAGNGSGVLWRMGATAHYGDPLTTVYTATYP
jgi:hypothetical protein